MLNENILVEVKSKDELRIFTYQVIAHGKILRAENVAFSKGKSHLLKVKATFDLVPKATIIVYCIKNGKMVAKKVEVTE